MHRWVSRDNGDNQIFCFGEKLKKKKNINFYKFLCFSTNPEKKKPLYRAGRFEFLSALIPYDF